METITLPKDIKVFYVPASSFPDGIMQAHETLHALVPFSTDRKFYGLSRPENGPIQYKAAAEEINKGEAEKFGCNILILKKGKYICLTVHDYIKDVQSIERAFQQLLKQPGLDPEGYCVELYLDDKDVQCMIRLEE